MPNLSRKRFEIFLGNWKIVFPALVALRDAGLQVDESLYEASEKVFRIRQQRFVDEVKCFRDKGYASITCTTFSLAAKVLPDECGEKVISHAGFEITLRIPSRRGNDVDAIERAIEKTGEMFGFHLEKSGDYNSYKVIFAQR